MSNYKIIGVYGDSNFNILHESDNVERANSWVVGYIRSEENMGGYELINVLDNNGFAKSEYSETFGWSHF